MIILSFLHVALLAFVAEYLRRTVFTITALFKKTPGFLPQEKKAV